MRTVSVSADELQLGDYVVISNEFFTSNEEFEIITIQSLRLIGDDVEMGTLGNPEAITTSRSNKVAIIPRYVELVSK